MYSINLTTPPTSEPVSLAEMKRHLRVETTADDGDITAYMVAARMHCERQYGRAYVASGWTLTMDRFPSGFVAPGDWRGYPVGAWRSLAGNLLWPDFATIRLPRSPLVSVQAVKYLDQNGVLQTVDPTTYIVSYKDPGLIAPVFGQFWPVARTQIDAISVNFTAGYPVTSVAASVATGSQIVTPASMTGIVVGSVLGIDPGTTVFEQVAVTAVTSTTFAATFNNAHTGPWAVNSVPENLRTAVKLLTAHWYAFREPAITGTIVTRVQFALDALLNADWNGEYS